MQATLEAKVANELTKKGDDELTDIIDDIFPTMMIVMVIVMFMFMFMSATPALAAGSTAQTYYARQLSQGISDPRTLHSVRTVFSISLSPPWIAATFTNNGPDEVMMSINQPGLEFPVPVGRIVTINRMGAEERIHTIYHHCHVPGETAEVDVIGEY